MNDIVTRAVYDESTDKLHISRIQDAEPIIQEVRELKEVTDGRGDSIKGYFVGRIPAMVVEQYLIEVGVTFEDFVRDDTHVKRIMNNPDYAKFRIFEGKI